MSYRQTKSFSLSRMGTRSGWCLQNCRLGFGINSGSFESALADMQSQRRNGTLHDVSTIPKNCAVPVYCDTPSRYEHVIVYDHGKVYSDGRLSSLSNFHIFGWGELCDGVRVVEFVPDRSRTYEFSPDYCDGMLPNRNHWELGDKHANIATIASWLRKNYPAYTKKEALGDYFGPNLKAAVSEFQRRARISKKYNGAVDGMIGPKTYGTMRAYGFAHPGIKPVENPAPKPTPEPVPTPKPVEPEKKPEPEEPAPTPQKPAEQPEETKPQEQPKPAEKPAKPQENGQNGQNKPAEQETLEEKLAEAHKTIESLTKTVELLQFTQKKHGLPSFVMPSKLYDVLKFAATTGLPAINTLYIGLAGIWGFGFGPEVDKTVQLIIAFINALLGAVVIKASADHRKATGEK